MHECRPALEGDSPFKSSLARHDDDDSSRPAPRRVGIPHPRSADHPDLTPLTHFLPAFYHSQKPATGASDGGGIGSRRAVALFLLPMELVRRIIQTCTHGCAGCEQAHAREHPSRQCIGSVCAALDKKHHQRGQVNVWTTRLSRAMCNSASVHDSTASGNLLALFRDETLIFLGCSGTNRWLN